MWDRVLGGQVTEIMSEVVGDYWSYLKEFDSSLYVDRTMNAMMECRDSSKKGMTHHSIFNGEITLGVVSLKSVGEYWCLYHEMLPNFGPVTLTLTHHQSGQGASESFHNAEKHISTKSRNKLSDQVKGALTELKMSRMCKRSELEQEQKTYQCADRVTVLGLVCDKMTKRVRLVRQEDEDRRSRQERSGQSHT